MKSKSIRIYEQGSYDVLKIEETNIPILKSNEVLIKHHYLGLNYGKIKKFDLSSYALAEKYLLVNEFKNAKIHIKRVKKISKDYK